MKPICLLFFLLIISTQAYTQDLSISGSVATGEPKITIPGVTVILQALPDSAMVKGTVTDVQGRFKLDNINPGSYNLKLKYVGYMEINRSLTLNAANLQLGSLLLLEEATDLTEVTVFARRAVSEQKGDTTSFNADAFKTLSDASAENLVQKMPGIVLENGTLQAQGENIVQILVDGKPFFGTDVRAALQNLPAEIIQSIQIFDKKSDKAELSGFDDGLREKTINIITKPNSKRGQFGKTSLGYGTDGRYMFGTSMNAFKGDKRITITGLSNNINAMNFSGDPNSQGEARTQDGIITTNSFGANFSDQWGEKMEVTASYLYTNRKNIGLATLVRDFILPESEGQIYSEEKRDVQVTNSHRFDLRMDYQIDSNNRILYRPRLSARFDEENSNFSGSTMNPFGLLNQTENNFNSLYSDYDLINRLFYSRKMAKKGRSFTLGLYTGNHRNEDNGLRTARNIFFQPEQRFENLNQNILRDRSGMSWEIDLSYTEPIGKNGMVEVEYEIGNRINKSERLIFDLSEQQDTDDVLRELNTSLSNSFNSLRLAQEFEIGYQYAKDKLKIQAEAEVQQVQLNNIQEFPRNFELERTFRAVLPTLRMNYQFTPSNRLELDFDTNTNTPTVGDLQAVIDNSNPLQLRTGNPALDQSYTKRFRLRYRSNNSETDRSFFVFVQSSLENDRVSMSSFVAQERTELEDGIYLERGSQLFRPVNLDGYQDFRSFVSYGLPVEMLKSNLNINGGVNYTIRPGMINEEINLVNSTRLRGGLTLSSNVSDRLDFNLSTWSSYNLVDNSIRPNLNNNFLNQSSRINMNWIMWKGIVYRMDVNHQLNTGLAEGFDNSFVLMNMSVGKKMFNNERGEMSLHVYDLFGQNNNIRRNITDTYIEDRQSNVLQRYVMLTFTYNLRRFSKGSSMEDFERN